MRIMRIPLVLLALVGLIALSGCGGDDETTSTEATTSTSTDSSVSTPTTAASPEAQAYAEGAQQVLLDFGTSFTTLGSKIQASKDEQEFASLVDQAESQIQGTIDDYSQLQPPEEAQQGHDQIIAALEDFASKLTAVSDAAASGDKQALQTAAQELQAAGQTFQTQLTEAAQSLQDAGISLQGSPTGG